MNLEWKGRSEGFEPFSREARAAFQRYSRASFFEYFQSEVKLKRNK